MKSIFQFKPSWIFGFLFCVFAFVLVLHYYQPPEEASMSTTSTQNPQSQIISKPNIPLSASAQVCLDIDEQGLPLATKTVFGNPDYVYCWIEFQNNPARQQIQLVWVRDNEAIHQIQEWIDPGSDIIWSKFNFPSPKTGQCSARIIDENGIELCHVQFTVKGYAE
jgi:hypothetical protein